MSDTHPPAQQVASVPPLLDARLVQWMAVQALQDRYARLADGGADGDTRIDLAAVFIPSHRAAAAAGQRGARSR